MGGVSGAVIFGVARHRTLLQLFDPFDLPLKTVADVDGKPRVFGIEDVPLWATFEGVGVVLEEVLESVDPTIELLYLGPVIVFSLLNCFEQRLGDALQGVGVEIGAHVEDVRY